MRERTVRVGGAGGGPSAASDASPGASASHTEASQTAPACNLSFAQNFKRLPVELRLKIWWCATEPRVVILDDLIHRPEAYPLPTVAQVNREARLESRKGYEAVGPRKSSHVHFARDIFVCDATITEATSNEPLEALATRVERLAFWDCYPDDNRVELPYFYSTYLAASQAAASAAMISAGAGPSSSTPSTIPRLPAVDFDKLWFPNLRDLWIVKVGGVNSAWLIDADLEQETATAEATRAGAAVASSSSSSSVPLSQHPRSRETARKFRYWVQDNVVEMAPLSLDDPDTRLVLREGRCGRRDCQELNQGRPVLLSKVTFMEGKYESSNGWLRIAPWDGRNATSTSTSGSSTPGHDTGDNDADARTSRDSMRWIVVERILTFSLRWESPDDTEKRSRRDIGSQTHS
ncbi:hypothetical protein NLG97_g3191 [Lecanicillium saksenae]|uniref:Uncharacterized protein n=1 Tax=Lecanicillium saksenae TaxID=468837 RepID=A0ACC1QYS0_9HYPO|nr:hypothetical protein NLG97_g3191 [Lecanicillium saksenae]